MATSLGYQINRNPIAQSFNVEEACGIYVTKIDLYFKSRNTSSPVCLQLRPMINGIPSNSEIIPQGIVYVNGSNINISDDATAVTSFVFEEPVFLQGLNDYAFVVMSNSPDCQIWIAQIDEFLTGTTAGRVAKNPAVGNIFYSANGGSFTAAQDQDLTFEIHRAEFNTGDLGKVALKNTSVPQKLLNADPIQTFAGSSTVRIADVGHGFIVNDGVTIRGMDSAALIGGMRTTSIMGASKNITAVDWTGYEITADSAADSASIGGGFNVLATKNIPWSTYYNNIQLLVPDKTSTFAAIKATSSKSFAGTETAYQKDLDFKMSKVQRSVYTTKANVVANNEMEVANLGAGVKSLEQEVVFTTSNPYVAPMLDMQRASMTLIDAIIDNQDSAATVGYNVPLNYISETQPSGGSSASKHITRKITVVEPAVGLKVILDAHRPNGTSFDLYTRTCEEGVDIETINWVLAPTTSNNPIDNEGFVFREYQYLVGNLGGELPDFTTFQLKIVMNSVNKGRAPIIKDLRVIALSV